VIEEEEVKVIEEEEVKVIEEEEVKAMEEEEVKAMEEEEVKVIEEDDVKVIEEEEVNLVEQNVQSDSEDVGEIEVDVKEPVSGDLRVKLKSMLSQDTNGVEFKKKNKKRLVREMLKNRSVLYVQ
jgi:hypothetical protein